MMIKNLTLGIALILCMSNGVLFPKFTEKQCHKECSKMDKDCHRLCDQEEKHCKSQCGTDCWDQCRYDNNQGVRECNERCIKHERCRELPLREREACEEQCTIECQDKCEAVCEAPCEQKCEREGDACREQCDNKEDNCHQQCNK